MSTRTFLLVLVVLLLAPGLAFTALLLNRYAETARDGYRQQARFIARQMANAIDQDLTGLKTTLQALATSARVDDGDLGAFYGQLQTVRSSINTDLGLRSLDGQQLLNTRVPLGSPLPKTPLQVDAEVIARRQAVVTDVFIGAVAKRPLFALVMPVPTDGAPRYLLHVSVSTDRIADVVTESLPPGWLIGVGDRRGVYVARSERHAEFTGKPGQPAYLSRFVGDEGTFSGRDAEGRPVLVGYARSSVSGWTVAANVPNALIEQPLRRDLMLLAGFGALALIVSAVLIYWLSRMITEPLKRLAAAGAELDQGETAVEVSTPIREIRDLADALGRAVRNLKLRTVERQNSEAALKASEARLRAVFDTVPVGLVIADMPSGALIENNRHFETIIGAPPLRTRSIGDYGRWVAFHPDGRPFVPEEYPLAKLIREGLDRCEMEFILRRADGADVWVRVLAVPIRISGADTAGALVTVLDIDGEKRSEQKLQSLNDALETRVAARTRELNDANRTLLAEMRRREAVESQLRQMQKMEAIGQLTGGIAHDFNNMLAVIIGGLNLVRTRLQRGDTDVGRFVDAAHEGAQRAADLTTRLLAFSRQQPLSPEPLDVNRLVAGMSELLQRTLGEAVRVETVVHAGLWLTHADAAQLESALINLAANARDAMPEGGRLTIETANALIDEHYSREHEGVVPGQYVLLAVTDTGEGMSREVMARAFDPFFTTKEVGKGTGLGLSQVYGFVKQSGGHVKIYSEPRAGTTVKLYLPRFYGGVEPAAPPSEVRSLPRSKGREVVLVVEDEERVRQLSVASLTELGYTVLQARDAVTALRVLDANANVALLFTDIVMPDINGRKLAEEAQRRRPALKVLYTTGFTRNAVVHNGVLDAGVTLLQKPFTLQQLAAKVREILDN